MAMREGVEIKHIQWFVWGAISEWKHHNNLTEDYYEYSLRTMTIVIAYVQGTRTALGGALSDLQCSIAIEAKKLFSLESELSTVRDLLQKRKEFWLRQPDSDKKESKIRELEVLSLVFTQHYSK
jgi:hypothetical protein